MGAARGAWRWAGRVGVALATGAVLITGAGPAAAAQGDGLTPFVDCITKHANGSWTAVLGYENTGRTAVSVPVGARNKVTPDKAAPAVPTTFAPGLHRGVFSVTVSKGAGVVWHLGDDNLRVRENSGPACPPPTEMPADGNGTGPALALGASGLVGAVLFRRLRRRVEVSSEAAPGGRDA